VWQFAAECPAADEISIDSAMQHVQELSSNGIAADKVRAVSHRQQTEEAEHKLVNLSIINC